MFVALDNIQQAIKHQESVKQQQQQPVFL